MRKVLLGTTALVAVSLLASGVAYAQDEEAAPAEEPMAEEAMAEGDEMMADDEMMAEEEMMEEAPASDGISLGLGGNYYAALGFAAVDNKDLHSPGIQQNSEVHILGDTTLDNGLSVSASVQAVGHSDAGGVDENKLSIGGNFGTLSIGNFDNAAEAVTVWQPSAAGTMGLNSPFFNFSGFNTGGFYTAGGAQDSAKVAYFTPSFNGVQLGASFAPEATFGGGNVPGMDTYKDKFAVGLSYTGDFGDSSVSAKIGYETSEANAMCNSAVSYLTVTDMNMSMVRLGEQIADITSREGRDAEALAILQMTNDAATLADVTDANRVASDVAYAEMLGGDFDGADDAAYSNPLLADSNNDGTADALVEVGDANRFSMVTLDLADTTSMGAMQNCEPTALRYGASITSGPVTVSAYRLVADVTNDHESTYQDAGVKFDGGAYAVALLWSQQSVESVMGGENETSRYAVNFGMPLGTGVALEAQVDTGEFEPAGGGAGTEWTQFMLGTALNF